jgi:hypothetical protein
MRELGERDRATYERSLLELNYLANVLIAGAPHGGRALRPSEAAEAVMAIAGEGLARLDAEAGGAAPALVARHGVVKLFRVGWHLRQQGSARPGSPPASRPDPRRRSSS